MTNNLMKKVNAKILKNWFTISKLSNEFSRCFTFNIIFWQRLSYKKLYVKNVNRCTQTKTKFFIPPQSWLYTCYL